METRIYTLKGFRRDNRGSSQLLNAGMTRYKEEIGICASQVTLSELRRETLPEDITSRQITLSDGATCSIAFDTCLALNEMRLSSITPQRLQITLPYLPFSHLTLPYERFANWLRTMYPGAQVKQMDGNEYLVTLNQEFWNHEDEDRWLYAPVMWHLMREELQEILC